MGICSFIIYLYYGMISASERIYYKTEEKNYATRWLDNIACAICYWISDGHVKYVHVYIPSEWIKTPFSVMENAYKI